MSAPIKISRSRTAAKRTQSTHAEFRNAFAHLREINYQQPAEEPTTSSQAPTKRNPGRPRKPSRSPSISDLPPTKKRSKKQPKPSKIISAKKSKGKRTRPIGGAELRSDIEVTAGVSQRSVGQTCQPKTSDAAAQVIRCQKCDDLGHIGILCSGVSATERPPPFFCHQCSVSYKYTSSTQMTTSIQLCSAHRLQAEETTKRKEKAGRILDRVTALTAGGTSLGDAIKLMGLNEQQYNKLRIVFDL